MTGETKNTFRINFGLFLAEVICIPAFIFELKRALDGNALSWAYVFEWPLLGGYAIYMWRKLLQDERGESTRPPVTYDEQDPELDAWNAYLATVHQTDQSATPDNRDV
jgi:hypothetical protein